MTVPFELDQVFARAQAGDARSLAELLRRQRTQVIRYAMRLCISPEDAEDAAQEALLALTRYVAALRQAAALSSWLFTAVRTHCTRLARRALRQRFAPSIDVAAAKVDAPSPEDLVVDEQLRQRLSVILSELPAELREVVVRRDVLGEPSEDVARTLGLSLEGMKSRLHRARRDVKRRLLAQLASARSVH